ncbi:hypothetical protein OH76DRAFT_813857 [Lentinus brumalis]|uniref:Uncharacterized protein n=1 Tax=Lentinus brumalis TaxID=2498619 RepID=A0A371D2G7_9APHY|nr:hypothetical protein OH76DRAFT_813857 [Polyporus brumalis]
MLRFRRIRRPNPRRVYFRSTDEHLAPCWVYSKSALTAAPPCALPRSLHRCLDMPKPTSTRPNPPRHEKTRPAHVESYEQCIRDARAQQTFPAIQCRPTNHVGPSKSIMPSNTQERRIPRSILAVLRTFVVQDSQVRYWMLDHIPASDPRAA